MHAGDAQRTEPASATDQDRFVRFLGDPATHLGAPVEHLETHISHVFLVGDYAFKMKKAVRFEFVDFSTLSARKRACAQEIKVNSRAAPEIYLDIVAVNEKQGALSLGPPTSPVEYLVRMRRFPQEGLFDRLAAEGKLTPALVRGLADRAAELHLSAAPEINNEQAEDFEITATDLLTRLAATDCTAGTRSMVAAFQAAMTASLQSHLPKARARARHGGVRHGHGDLHLRNICLFDGEVRLFDAIEFEPRYSHIDILYDVAFAAMDLLHRNANAEAIVMLSRYLSATRDYGSIDLLRLFMSTRAGIRALVSLLEGAATRDLEAQSYLSLAHSLLAPPTQPLLVGIGGRSGTGKSTLAFALAPSLATAPDLVVIRADEVRKRVFDAAPECRLPNAAYAPEVTDCVYRRIFRDARRTLRNGGSVILDASFLKPEHRSALHGLGDELGIATTGLWLTGPTDTLAARLNSRTNDASDADATVMRRQPEPRRLGKWHRLRTDRQKKTIVHDARAIISENDPGQRPHAAAAYIDHP